MANAAVVPLFHGWSSLDCVTVPPGGASLSPNDDIKAGAPPCRKDFPLPTQVRSMFFTRCQKVIAFGGQEVIVITDNKMGDDDG